MPRVVFIFIFLPRRLLFPGVGLRGPPWLLKPFIKCSEICLPTGMFFTGYLHSPWWKLHRYDQFIVFKSGCVYLIWSFPIHHFRITSTTFISVCFVPNIVHKHGQRMKNKQPTLFCCHASTPRCVCQNVRLSNLLCWASIDSSRRPKQIDGICFALVNQQMRCGGRERDCVAIFVPLDDVVVGGNSSGSSAGALVKL